MNVMNSYTSLIKSSGAGDKVFKLLDRTPPSPGTGSPRVIAGGDVAAAADEEVEVEAEAARDAIAAAGQRGTGEEYGLSRCRNETETGGGDDNNGVGIQFDRVTFAYPSRPSRAVLNDLSLTVEPGSTTALVGPSGCGKSTVIGLIERFYDPGSGSLAIGGADLRKLDVSAHRRRVGIVTQDPVLFTGTILSNIKYGRPTATLEEVIEAATLANAHGFVSAFPDGYSTEVGERGVQLRYGSHKRIGLFLFPTVHFSGPNF